MKIRYSSKVLDRYVAPGISSFSKAEIPDLQTQFPSHKYWMTLHLLGNILKPVKTPYRQYATSLVYRVRMCFAYYHSAKEYTLKYLENLDPASPSLGTYYKAISLWESAFLNWSICADIVRKLSNEKVFEEKDGSSAQRAYDIANQIKHWGDRIRLRKAEESPIPIWLTNEGFSSASLKLAYHEFSDLVEDAARLPDEILTTKGLVKPK